MNDDTTPVTRRRLLTSTGAALAGLCGCAGLPIGGTEPPDYDSAAMARVIDADLPAPPAVFPVAIPGERFDRHETRTRELVAAVPEQPDIPNGVIASNLERDRAHQVDRLDEPLDDEPPRERLGSWRYRREKAAELWGRYEAATSSYTRNDFEERVSRIRAAYTDFHGTWEYRGRDPTTALVVHHSIEGLVDHGHHNLYRHGPYPADPPSSVEEAGGLIGDLERAAANLEDARAIRDQYQADDPDTSYRWRFTGLGETLRHRVPRRLRREYGDVVEHGREGLDVDVERGPAGLSIEHTWRRYRGSREAYEDARTRHHPANTAIYAARHLVIGRVFVDLIEDVEAETIGWPADAASLRDRRDDAFTALDEAWNTTPRHLARELVRPIPAIVGLRHNRDREHAGERDIASYVAGIEYVRRYANEVPDVLDTVIALLDD